MARSALSLAPDSWLAAPNDYIELGTSSGRRWGTCHAMDMLHGVFKNDSGTTACNRPVRAWERSSSGDFRDTPNHRSGAACSWARAIRSAGGLGSDDSRFSAARIRMRLEHLVEANTLVDGMPFAHASQQGLGTEHQ